MCHGLFQIEQHRRLDSTNRRALHWWRERSRTDAATPLLVIAEEQTAGIGRRQRPWRSPRGGLWLSIAWPLCRSADHYHGLPLAAGLAVAEAIGRTAPVEGSIKWPNDVLIDGRKAAGILCQFEPGPAPAIVVGVGINANFTVDRLGGDLRQPATTLMEAAGGPVDLDRLRQTLVERLAIRLEIYDETGLTTMHRAIVNRLHGRGRVVGCRLPGGGRRIGRLAGLDDDGRLRLTTSDGPVSLSVGEIVHLDLHLNLNLPPNPQTPRNDPECSYVSRQCAAPDDRRGGGRVDPPRFDDRLQRLYPRRGREGRAQRPGRPCP